MKYEVVTTNQFRRDMKLAKRRGYDPKLISYVIEELANGNQLDEKYRDHALVGQYNGFRECHISPDWLLVYKIHENELLLILSRTGTHSDLFR